MLMATERAGSRMRSSPPELPKPLLSGQPAKFSLALSALPAASVSTAVVDSEEAQIWVRSSPNPDAVSLLASSSRAPFKVL